MSIVTASPAGSKPAAELTAPRSVAPDGGTPSAGQRRNLPHDRRLPKKIANMAAELAELLAATFGQRFDGRSIIRTRSAERGLKCASRHIFERLQFSSSRTAGELNGLWNCSPGKPRRP